MDQQKKDFTCQQIIENINSLLQTELDFQNASVSAALIIEKTTIHTDISFEGTRFASNVEFKNVTAEKMVDFKGAVFEGPVIFKRAVFNDILDLRSCTFQDQVIFEDVEARDKILLNDAKFLNSFEIKRGNFKSDVCLMESSFANKFSISLSWFNGEFSLLDAALAKDIELHGLEFNKAVDLSCSDETKSNKNFNKFTCNSSSFSDKVSFRGRKFLGLTSFQNVNFERAPLFANCIFSQDIFLSNIKFHDVESEEAALNYRILKDILEECGDEVKAKFFKKLEDKTRLSLNTTKARNFLIHFSSETIRVTRNSLLLSNSFIKEVAYLLKMRQYDLLSQRIFRTNYRRFYNYNYLKNLFRASFFKSKDIRNKKLHILH